MGQPTNVAIGRGPSELGEPLRVSFMKLNANLQFLYQCIRQGSTNPVDWSSVPLGSGSTVTNWTLLSAKLGGPTLTNPAVTGGTFVGPTLTNVTLRGGAIAGVNLSNVTAAGLTASNATLTSPQVTGGSLNNVTLSNATIAGLALSNAVLSGGAQLSGGTSEFSLENTNGVTLLRVAAGTLFANLNGSSNLPLTSVNGLRSELNSIWGALAALATNGSVVTNITGGGGSTNDPPGGGGSTNDPPVTGSCTNVAESWMYAYSPSALDNLAMGFDGGAVGTRFTRAEHFYTLRSRCGAGEREHVWRDAGGGEG